MSETTPQQAAPVAAAAPAPTTTTSPGAPAPKPVPQSHLQHMVDSSLISFLDRQVCVYTLDGSMFVGELNGFDTVNSVTLSKATQRWVNNGTFAEREVGTIYLAGVNVLMIGTRDDKYLNELKEVPVEDMLKAQQGTNTLD